MANDKWLMFVRRNPRARTRLFCFPNAGGDAALFHGWPALLPADVEVCGIQLPGRGTRFGEEPCRRLGDVVSGVVDALTPHAGMPYALFGHSFGALVAFEVARRLQRRLAAPPLGLFASSFFDPASRPTWERLHALPAPEFQTRMRAMNGIPDAVWESEDLRELVLARLRADFALMHDFAYQPGELLDCPIAALGGTGDPLVPGWHLPRWRAHTRADLALQTFPGDHFYLHQQPRPVIDFIVSTLHRWGVAAASIPIAAPEAGVTACRKRGGER